MRLKYSSFRKFLRPISILFIFGFFFFSLACKKTFRVDEPANSDLKFFPNGMNITDAIELKESDLIVYGTNTQNQILVQRTLAKSTLASWSHYLGDNFDFTLNPNGFNPAKTPLVKIDKGNFFVVGTSHEDSSRTLSDIVISKINASGNIEFIRNYSVVNNTDTTNYSKFAHHVSSDCGDGLGGIYLIVNLENSAGYASAVYLIHINFEGDMDVKLKLSSANYTVWAAKDGKLLMSFYPNLFLVDTSYLSKNNLKTVWNRPNILDSAGSNVKVYVNKDDIHILGSGNGSTTYSLFHQLFDFTNGIAKGKQIINFTNNLISSADILNFEINFDPDEYHIIYSFGSCGIVIQSYNSMNEILRIRKLRPNKARVFHNCLVGNSSDKALFGQLTVQGKHGNDPFVQYFSLN